MKIRLRNIKKLLSQLPLPFWVSFYIFLLLITLPVLAYIGNFGGAAPGTLTVTIDQKSGTNDPNPSYTSVFTVQFSEAIDRATFTDADITLAGTAPGQSVQSITEAGSFDQTTYEVRIQAISAGTITPSIAQELITAQNGGSGTNQASTSTDNSVTYNGDWAPGEFVMRVRTNNPGATNNLSFTIPVNNTQYSYNYNIDCDNNGSIDHANQTGNVVCVYGAQGDYDVVITGTFPHLKHRTVIGSPFQFQHDPKKILNVSQWGTGNRQSMEDMFLGSSNLRITAIDAPNLSEVEILDGMFEGASSMDDNINHWDTSNVTSLDYMFAAFDGLFVVPPTNASYMTFNQPLSEWDTSNVSSINYTFRGNEYFNQPLNNWDTSSVNEMMGTFYYALDYNQPLNNWDTSNVVALNNMFTRAINFNQILSSWNVSQVSSANSMFAQAASFNQPINNWDTSNFTNISYMFSGAFNFNQPLNNWDTSNVLNMYGTFANAINFNQPLNTWDTSSVNYMGEAFAGAVSFNQPLNNWNVSQVWDMQNMFAGSASFDQSLAAWDVSQVWGMENMFGSYQEFIDWVIPVDSRPQVIQDLYDTVLPNGLSTSNYDETLTAWSSLNLQGGVNFYAGSSTYCASELQRQSIIDNFGWTINDAGLDCTPPPLDPFIFRVKTDNPGNSSDTSFHIQHTNNGFSYNYDVDCNNDGTPEFTNQTGNVYCTYGSPGEYDIALSGTLPQYSTVFAGDAEKVIELKQWGDIEWQAVNGMFMNASNMVMTATDVPDLSAVSNLHAMFSGASSFNSDISNWDVSGILDMSFMFSDATSFNQSLNGWDVSNVFDMQSMFSDASSFNSSLSSWNTGQLENMSQMFSGATSFNQNINNWNTSNVIDMTFMFEGATTFNQPLNSWTIASGNNLGLMFAGATSFNQSLSNWNIPNASVVAGMFAGASSFDQSLAAWDVSNVENLSFMFGDAGGFFPETSGLTTANYDATLISWSQQNLQALVNFDAGTSKYCNAETQRQSMIDTYSWTINDSGKDCNASIGVPQNLTGTPSSQSIEVDWDDVDGTDRYELEYRVADTNDWLYISTNPYGNPINGSLFEVTGLISETPYDIRVRAVDSSDSVSEWSEVLTLATLAQQTYTITNCQELQSIAINPVTFEFGDASANYVLENDIDCSETATWTWDIIAPPEYNGVPLGFYGIMNLSAGQHFTGNFDGQGYSISGIYQNADIVPAGLFTFVSGSTLQNVTLEYSKIDQTSISPMLSNTYGIAAFVSAGSDLYIHNVHVKDIDIDVYNRVKSTAGLLGQDMGASNYPLKNGDTIIIEDSSSGGSIVINQEPVPTVYANYMQTMVGGVFGGAEVDNEFIVASQATYINKSYSDVDIIYNLSDTDQQNIFAGGLAGSLAKAQVQNSYATGNLNIDGGGSTGEYFMVGGLVGFLTGSISNSYSSGAVNVTNYTVNDAFDEGYGSFVGGLLGFWYAFDAGGVVGPANIENTFSASNIDLTNTEVLNNASLLSNALVGFAPEGDTTGLMLNSYYDQASTGQDQCIEGYYGTPPSGTICTPVNSSNSQPNYFKNNSTNPPLDQWDFTNIWKTEANDYPTFIGSTLPPTDTTPSTPRNLSISNRSTTSLRLNWLAPSSDGGSPITGYRVQYRTTGSTTWITAPLQGPTPTRHDFTGLKPNTSYQFRVAAINAIGQGDYSAPITGSTLAPTPPPDDDDDTPPNTGSTTNTTPPPDPSTPTTDTETNEPASGTPLVPVPPSTQPGTGNQSPTSQSPAGLNLPILGAVIGPLVRLAEPVPTAVARTIPWSLLFVLVALSGFYGYSSVQEQQRRKALIELTNRFKASLAARATYLEITSHYIKTPLTKMQGVVELLKSGVIGSSSSSTTTSSQAALAATTTTLTIPENTIMAASSGLTSLTEHADQLLAEGQSLTGAQQAHISDFSKRQIISVLSHPGFWLPASVITSLTLLANVVFIQADKYDTTTINLASQILLGIIGILTLLVSLYFLQQAKAQKRLAQDQATIEADIRARQQQLIDNAANDLTTDLELLASLQTDIARFPKTSAYKQGITDLTTVIDQFTKLRDLTRSVPGVSWQTSTSAVVNHAITSLRSLADERGVTITTTGITKLPLANIEEAALLHLITAPLKNAIQASPQGSQVQLAVTPTTDHAIQLTITDHGSGIPADKLATVFEPFNSATGTDRFSDTGLGLDLYLAKTICEQYGAEIRLAGGVGGGTLATLIIPLRLKSINS